MKTVDIRYYANENEHLKFEGKQFVNMKTGEVVTGILGGIHTTGISSESILFEDAKGKTKTMLVRNFVKKYQLVIK